MTRIARAVAVVGVALVVSLATGTAAGAGPGTTRTFTGTGIISRYYTQQTVTGTLNGYRPVPSNVSVLDWQGITVITTAAPRLHNAFWGGYWKQNYHLNSWSLGKANGTAYHLMLPDTPLGGTFTGLLVSEFNGGGNWQNWIDFTVSP
jgi:hypothetical protein